MTQQSTEYLTELEAKAKSYLALIRRIDSILAAPVKTLIQVTERYLSEDREKQTGFPVWMSEDVEPAPEDDLFSKSICFATLQEVSRLHRRFSWLSKPDNNSLRYLLQSKKHSDDEEISNPNRLIKNLHPLSGDFSEHVATLSTKAFGALNPLTASQVFQVLLNDSERQAHGGLGFLAFFAMIWPLHRRFPDPQRFGAAIEPWEPKAYITAKCILPIKRLQDICTERAVLLREIVRILENFEELTDFRKYDPHQRWLFNAELDNLKASLLRLSSIVVAKKQLRVRAEKVGEISDALSQDSRKSITVVYKEVLKEVSGAIFELGESGCQVFRQAQSIVTDIKKEIVNRLKPSPHFPTEQNRKNLTEEKELKFAREYTLHPDPEVRSNYYKDLYQAADDSQKFLVKALDTLNDASRNCLKVRTDLKSRATGLADANKQVAEFMDQLVRQATVWCRAVVDREIAHASAQNLTDFDPSELVSAIAVAVKWNQMTTTLQVSDAVSKALAGVRADGSWSPGQPFYSPNNALAIWPVTSDVVLTLTDALAEHREVEVADTALFRYVDWLELTRTQLNFPIRTASANNRNSKSNEPAVGWASDRLRNKRKIHFPTTAFSVNALLKIRDLVEYRLWQLCEKRFTVIKSENAGGLKKVTPVDLGAQHAHRLHRHLAGMAEAARTGADEAEYSLVLHGPPGSSKTFIAKALSVEMWKATRQWGSKEGPRLIRITPADFTRMGEDRLDSEARLIFDLISGVRGVTIFFDEIDDLLRQRNTSTGPNGDKPTFMELVIPAMLNRLADLREACPRQEICFLLATNFVETIEPALLRKGRIDSARPVVYADQESRVALITNLTSKQIVTSEFRDAVRDKLGFEEDEATQLIRTYYEHFASRLVGWPYLTIESACNRITQKWNSILKEMVSDKQLLRTNTRNGKHALTIKRRRFLKKSTQSIEQVIMEFGSSVSQPNYDQRLRRPFRPELLDEYAHYIIARSGKPKDLEKWIKAYCPMVEGKNGTSTHDVERTEALCEQIYTLLQKENRWPNNSRIRKRLLERIRITKKSFKEC